MNEKTNKIKTIVMVVAIILSVALAVGWIAQTVANNQKKTPSGIEQTEPDGIEEYDNLAENNGLIVTPTVSNSLMRLAASPLSASENDIATVAENSYTLTATIEPSNASNQTLDWAAVWKDSASSWASGKTVTDYVTVTPTSSGAMTATVSCLEAFGEQVIITATTKDGTNLSAQCTCDYVKRVTKTELKVPKSSMSDDVGFDTAASSGPWYVKLYPNVGSTGASSITTTPVYGVGTVEDELTTVVSYGLSSNYYNVLASKGYTITSDNYALINNATSFQGNKLGCQELLGSNFFSDVGYANAVISSLGIAGNCMVFTVTTTGKYSTCTNTYQAFVKTDAMSVKATSVNISDSNIKF